MSITLIVVVEDKVEEQQNALEAIKRALVTPGDEELLYNPEKDAAILTFNAAQVQVQFAPNLAKARRRIDFASTMSKAPMIAGVLTDLMFPAEKMGKEEPNGLSVLAICIANGLPVVVCSDTDHHDVGYLKEVFPILGKAHPKGEIPIILDKKDWDKAVAELLRMLKEA